MLTNLTKPSVSINMNALLSTSVILILSNVLCVSASTLSAPHRLRVNYLRNPLATSNSHVTFSWQLHGRLDEDRYNLSQTAYQILTATNPDDLLLETPDLWDSGKIHSTEQVNIIYEGHFPAPGKRIYWTVRAWDQKHDASNYANFSFWDTEYNVSQWRARWISAPEEMQKHALKNLSLADENVVKSLDGLKPALYLRKTFSLNSAIEEAKIYATAKGLYKLFVNGDFGVKSRTNGPLLTPGWTDYSKSIQYQVYNVTEFMKSNNTLGVLLGTGWHSGYIGFNGAYGYYGVKEEFLMELHIQYKNGSQQKITTDNTWRVSTGSIIYSDLLHGELQYESRASRDWLAFDFDDSKWSRTNSAAIETKISFIAEQSPPIRELDYLVPQHAWESSPGVWVYDFGVNFAGYVTIKVNNFTSVTRVQVRHAEMLNPNGTIYTLNLRKALATDTYLLNAPKTRPETIVLKPHFTYHGFRYVEVVGFQRKLDFLKEITAVRIGIDGINNHLSTDNKMVNTLLNNIRTSHLANFISVPTDCPQRDERLGWMGDAQVFAHTATYNGDVAAFYRKWLRDIREAQYGSGGYSNISPNIIIPIEGGPAWGDAGVIVTWHVYRMYGDIQLVRDNYEAMKRWIDFIWAGNPNLIWINRATVNLGDWLNPGEETEKSIVATAYFAYDSLLFSQMAYALGKDSDSEKYKKLHSDISNAFVNKFVNQTDGKFLNDTQTAYVLALAFQLLTPELIPKAVQHLVDNIKRHDWHLTTGFIGVGYILPVLSENGQDDVAYKLLMQNTYPSWGYMIDNNATSVWERWDGWSKVKGFQDPGMNSFNHYALGSVGRWLYQYMAGIDTDNEAVGFKKIIIKPHIGSGINSSTAHYHSPQGLIKVAWNIIENNFNLMVEIPVNSRAVITLPFLKDKWTREILSGEYNFTVPLK